MSLVVQKYGGTSVGDAGRISNVARRVVETRKAGNDVVVVVSAMGQTTDELIELATQVSSRPTGREMDMLLTAGERISMALLAMAIRDLGVEAASLTGSQAGILTDSTHGGARITAIKGDRVRQYLDDGLVVIVAGFQGVDPASRDVTTLGRGGSDATAVALAATLRADVCEIFTDVDGVYTADPRLVADAYKLDEVSYEDMLELAGAGAGVLMARSVEFARRFGIPVHVRSSFHDGPGTWIKEDVMEEAVVTGVAHDTTEAKVTVHGVPDQPGIAAKLFGALAADGVIVDMIVQNVSTAGHTDISFTVPDEHLEKARSAAEAVLPELQANGVDVEANIAKVSLVGTGMRNHPGVAADMFAVLAANGINISMISTSAVRISCVIDAARCTEAVQALHAHYLEKEPV
ncbi:MAG: aspartate kinase [Acidimicrobiia bacterium]|nr:aspartate kinase [Acidimicrobiia bacterium]NNL69346.1 aspartate kinase [Acidimicrobiia bacterium]